MAKKKVESVKKKYRPRNKLVRVGPLTNDFLTALTLKGKALALKQH